MLVTILPFFLAAHVAIDPYGQSGWAMYGPECTYDVLVNMSLANILHEDDNFCAMIATELKCRPKGHDILSCHFQNSKIKRPDPEDGRCSNAKNFVPTRYPFVGEEPFEVRFNPRGIENLVVYRTIPRWRIDMIKVIVSQLNIGFEVQERRQRFIMMENSTMGHCEVDVKVTHGEPESDEEDSTEGGNFEIGFMSSSDELGQPVEEEYQVEKVRQPKKCPRRTMYFFGNHEDYSRSDRKFYMDMATSVSHIAISRNKFVSYTISEGVMKTANKSRIMRPQQNITLKLKRIDFARSSLPEIKNPASTSLFAFSSLEATSEDI